MTARLTGCRRPVSARRSAPSGRCRRRRRCRRSRPPRTSKETPRTFSSPRSSSACSSSTVEQRLAGLRRSLLDAAAATSRPTIIRASSSSVAPSRGTVSTFFPRRRTVIRSAISSTSLSLWLMKMIDMPSLRQRAQDLEQLRRLLRREHGGRLVEDQDVRLAVERLQDLDALLLADGDVLDARVRVDVEAEASRRAPRTRSCGGAVVEQDAAPRRLDARGRCSRPPSCTGMSMKCWCTMPMPCPDRVLRRSGT